MPVSSYPATSEKESQLARRMASLGIREEDVGLPLGGQDDHAAMVSRADRVVSFT